MRETTTSLVPYSHHSSEMMSEVALKSKREENNSIVPYDHRKSTLTQPVLTTASKMPLQKKKEIIDFTTFNKYLYLRDNEFLYCKRVGNPIQFIECVYSELMPKKDKKTKKIKTKHNLEYITMSKNTVMQYINGNCVILSVPEWIDFCVKFKKLLSIRLFKNYRTAKLFDLWRKFYKKSMKTLYTEKLKKKFHHIDHSLLTGIFEIRALLKEMSNLNIFKLDSREPVTLTRFQEDHKNSLKELDNLIELYRKNVKKIIEKSCNTSYEVYKELKKITLEDNIIGNRKNGSKEDDSKTLSNFTKLKPGMKDESQLVQNFLKDSMPYAQDATRRTHYKKLLKYIRVMDFLFNEAKYSLIKNSLKNLAEKFSRLYDCYLNDLSDSPLLIVYDLPLHDQIHYIPHIEQVQKSVFEEYIQEKIYTVIYRKSFIDPQEFPNYMVCFEEVFEVSVDQNSNLNIRIKEDTEIGGLFQRIKKNFENCHSALDNFTRHQVPILINYNTYSSINFKALKEDATPDELKSLLQKFLEEAKTISQVKPKKNVGIFQFHMGNLLDKVQKMPSKWINDMRELIPVVLVNKLKNLINILNRDLKLLTIQVIDVETFISLKISVKEISEKKEDIDQKNSDIIDILHIIRDDKEIKIAEFDAKYIREKEALYVEFEKKLSDMGYFIENNIAKYKKELRDNITRFDKEIKNMMEELNVDTLNVYNEDNYSAIFYIENKSVAIKKLIDKKEFFRKQEESIEVEDKSDFENLNNLVYEYELKSKLWESVREFQDMTKIWETHQVMELDIFNMESHVEKWIEIGKVTEVDLENPNVPRVLLQKTKIYDLILPVLKTFQNTNIHTDDKFRDLISKTLKTDMDIKDKGFTLEKLMTLPDIQSKIPEVQELNNRANEEKRLSDIFYEVKDIFHAHKIPLKMERSTKQQNNEKGAEKWVIYPQDYDNEYEWIEEKMMTLKKTLLSPYSDVIRERVNKLLLECQKYLIFLDEYAVYQRFMNTVDSLFTPEILREVPSEYKRYLNESLVKTVTKQLKENANLNRYVETAHQKVYTNLMTINKNYEEFFAYVEEYLENRRRDCLKYYCVSNEELMEILSYPESTEVKNKYISKMIQGVKSLELGSEADETMKIATFDEEVLIIKLIKGRSIKDLIESIDIDIMKKLKNSFKSFRKDYETSLKSKSHKKTKDVLMDIIRNRDNLGQAIFNFMYSFFIDALEKALTTDDVFDKIIDIKIESKERKKNLIKLILDKTTSKLDRRILINQVALENYFNEIIKNLIREDCNSITDFNWLKILQMKIDSDQLFIKIFSSVNFEYGYEYVGLQNNFVVTPQTEKTYLTIGNCFSLRKPFFMYGLPDSGKKETLHTLSRTFGKSMTIFTCSEQFDVSSFNKLLYGSIKNGSWILLDRVDLVTREMMSVVSQHIMNVYRMLNDKDPSIEIKAEKFPLEKNIQIFCVSDVITKGNEISRNIKNYFRLIGNCSPDLNLFITISLKNLGIPKVKSNTKKIVFFIEYFNSKISSLKYKRVNLVIFNKILELITRELVNINALNFEKYLRNGMERAFMPLMNTEEQEDLQRVLNNCLGKKEGTRKGFRLSHAGMIDRTTEELIRENTQNYNFKGERGDRYVKKLSDIFNAMEEKNVFLFVGPSMSGKSEAMNIIQSVVNKQYQLAPNDEKMIKVVKIFPKAHESSFLFSENQKFSKIQFYNVFFNNQIKLLNSEGNKGFSGESTLKSVQNSPERKLRSEMDFNFDGIELSTDSHENGPLKILYFDGQIDPSWVDNLNLIHDNSHTRNLSQPNGDTLQLPDVKIIFETTNLTYATPSFITSNFIINFDYFSYTPENYLYNWIGSNPKIIVNNELKNYIRGLFENYFPKVWEFIQNNKLQIFNFSENYVMKNFISLFDSILPLYDFEEKRIGRKNNNVIPKIEIIKKSTLSIFIFSLAWTISFFTNFVLKTKIEKLISDIFKADDLKGPIFDYYIDGNKHEFELWSYLIENNEDFKYDFENILVKDTKNFAYNKLFIPTVENVPYQWIVSKYLENSLPIFYTGNVGTGKSLLLNSLLNDVTKMNTEYYSLRYLINNNSTSKKLENFLIQNLYYLKRDLSGDLFDRKLIFFIDDCNLQKKDQYDSQNCLESIRQMINIRYVYDMKNNMVKNLNRFNLLCSGNIMSYAKNPNVDRFIHSFCFVSQNNFSEDSQILIFKTTLEQHIKQFIPTTSSITSNQFVQSTITLCDFLKNNFKKTPKKIHYVFLLRDITKILQSVHNFAFRHTLPSEYSHQLEKLWFYETSRTFEDKMNKESDKTKIRKEALKIFNNIFKKSYKIENTSNQSYLFANEILSSGDSSSNLQKKEYVLYEDSKQLFDTIRTKLEESIKLKKNQHIVLNQNAFDLILKILRIFNYNKGHLILIGPTLTGKMSLSQFSAFILGKEFYQLDESHLSKLDAFMRNIIIEASYKNNPLVLFIGNSLLEKDEVLEMLNTLTNTREIHSHFDIQRHAEKDFGMKLEMEEFVSRIEKNLNISMCISPQSLSYQKLFYEYPYISKHSNILCIDKWEESTYQSLVHGTISTITTLNDKFVNFAGLLYEIHEFITTLSQEYSNKVMCKIEISTKNFTDMLNFYENNYNLYKEILLSQKKKYNTAVDAIPKTLSMISKMNEELEKLEPEKLDFEKAIDEKKAEFSKKQIQKTQITNLKNEEEKPLNVALNQKEEIKEKIYKNLEDAVDKITKTTRDLNRVQRSELLEYKVYLDGHPLSRYLLSQFYAFQGEASDLEHVKRNLDTKYIQNVTSQDYSNAPVQLVKFVRETVANPDFTTSENLQKVFKICGYMADWFQSLADYFDDFEKQKTLMDEIEELNKKIFEHEKIIKNHTDNLIEISKQIADIERDLQAKDKRKQQTGSQIEKREILKKIGEEYIEAAKEKNALWESKMEKVDITLSNFEFYMMFISVYVNYAAPFNFSHRNKIKNFLYKKAEDFSLYNLTPYSFYNLMMEFLDFKAKDKELILSLGTFDDYTKENFLLMHLNKKTPFIIDNNRISKWCLSDYIQWKEPKRLIFTKHYEHDFMDKVETAMKEGYYLFIEQSDEKTYNLFKNVIKDEKINDKGRVYVSLDGQLKEISEKFRLYFIKDKIDTKVNSKIWIESLVINFVPSRDLINSQILKELTNSQDPTTWNFYSKTLNEMLNQNSKLLELEDRMINVLNQFDYTGNVDKNSSNQNFLSNFKNESAQHTHFESVVYSLQDKILKCKSDMSKFRELSDDAARIYKLMSRFSFLDNIYNFSFTVYCNYIKEFYHEKIATKTLSDADYTKEDLLDLIMFVYDKVALLYTYDERKLLLFSLMLFYLSQKGEIPKQYRKILYLMKIIYFDKNLDTENFNEESPVKFIPKFEWNCLKEINEKSNYFFSNLIESIAGNCSRWEENYEKGLGVSLLEGITVAFDQSQVVNETLNMKSILKENIEKDEKNNQEEKNKKIQKIENAENKGNSKNEENTNQEEKILENAVKAENAENVENNQQPIQENQQPAELDQEQDSQSNYINLLTKIIFFVLVAPYRMEQLLREMYENILGQTYRIPQLRLSKALSQISNRNVVLVVDNDYLSEKEIIIYYKKKYSLESNNFYKIITLDAEINSATFEILHTAMKSGLLVLIKNIQYAKNSIIKLFEILEDQKTFINDAFRLVFMTKSNLILSNFIYENCIIMNRNIPKFNTIKDTIQDSIENIDIPHFEYLINRKNNSLFSRKIAIHLVITHSILKHMHFYRTGVYNNPIEYSKKDFLNCFYFISSYLNTLGDEKETFNNSQANYSSNNYSALMNLVFESFYCNRLIYKEEASRTMKVLQRYFEEDKFLNEKFYFQFKYGNVSNNNISNKSIQIEANTNTSGNPTLSSEDLMNLIDEIPLEEYYDMIINVPIHIINEKLAENARDFFRDFTIISNMSSSIYFEEMNKEDIDLEKFNKILTQFKNKLPGLIVLTSEASPQTFKLNKNLEYVNPLDESLKSEVLAYNDYLARINDDIETLSKILRNEVVMNNYNYNMILDTSKDVLPNAWKEQCFNFNKCIDLTLDKWSQKLNERFKILRSWLINTTCDVYNVTLFYNIRLFLYSIVFYFAKKASVSPELIKIKFFLTKYNTKEEMDQNEEYVKDLSASFKFRDIIYCQGFVIENAFLQEETLYLTDKKGDNMNLYDQLPLVGISYEIIGEDEKPEEEEEDDENEEDEISNEVKKINIPIYERENHGMFENVEPLGYLEMNYESKYKEEYWITKATRISMDF
jgi:energy-coupling factor transporter ATP-binding protein EcfA2